MDWHLLIYSLIVFFAIFFLLFFANYPRHLRYRQRCFPVVAFVLSILAILVYIYPYAFVEEIIAKIRDWINQYMGLALPSTPDRFPLLLNMLLLLLFFFVKASWRVISSIFSFGNWLAGWFSRVVLRRKQATKHLPQGTFPAYSYEMDRGITLLDGWIYPGQYLRIMTTFAAAILTGAIACDFLSTPSSLSLTLPALPVSPFLFFLESAWYLGGLRPDETSGVITGSDAMSTIEGRFELLWQKYRSLWKDRLLAASPDSGNRSDGLTPIIGKTQPVGQLDGVDLQIAEQCLSRQKIKLFPAQKAILSDLLRNRDLIVIEPVYELVAPVLFSRLQQHLLEGHNVLFLVPEHVRFRKSASVTAWIERWLDFPCFFQVPYFVSWGIEQSNNVCISTTNELLRDALKKHPEWFKRVRAVVVLDSMATISPNISGALALSQCLSTMAGKPPQYIFLSQEDRLNMESALRDFMGVEPEEYRLHHSASQCRRYLAWKYEGENPFQNEVIENDRYLGCEPVLAIPAIRDKVANIQFVGMEMVPWWEALEEIDKSLQSVGLRDVIVNSEISSMATPSEMPVVITHDALSNLPIAIKQGLSLGKKDVLVLSAAPPYLLRDYFAGNMDFFLATDATLRTRLAPSPLWDKYTIAYCLLNLLQLCSVRGDTLTEKLNRADYSANIEQGLDKLFKDVFGFELLRQGWLARESRFDFDQQSKTFKEVDYYRFTGGQRGELEYYKIVDPSGNIMALLPPEHVFQLYLPGQIHVFGGEPFKVAGIDQDERKVELQHAQSPSLCHYSPEMEIQKLTERKQIHVQSIEFPQYCFSMTLCEAEFEVKTKGYHTLYHKKHSLPSYEAFKSGAVPARSYRCGRMLKINVSRLDIQFDHRHIAGIFALMLQEALRTIFPESWRFLLVTAYGVSRPSREGIHLQQPIDLLPFLNIQTETEDDQLTFYIFEDSLRDMGLAKALYDNCLNIFDLLTDYVTWLLDSNDEGDLCLVHGVPFRIARNDIDICRQILEALISHFDHPITKQRIGFAARQKETGPATASRLCDFCGEKISGSSFERLYDGRERCQQCKDSAVESVAELEKIYLEARKWLVRRFSSVQLRKEIKICFTTAAEVAKEGGRAFVPTAGFDPRSIGFARRQNDAYSIYIENGQPYHMTLGTLIHEMTHIWQYDNLDMDGLAKEHGDLYIEGHATWVEVQCLNEHGVGLTYAEHQMQREDVYGRGARAVETLISSHSPSNPFLVLNKMFPK